MSDILRPVTALLVSTAVMLMGNGLLSMAVPLGADGEGFSTLWIGLLGTGYFAGFLMGCLGCPQIVVSVGHIRAFAAFTAIAVAAPLGHAMWAEPLYWMALRIVTGACIAGLTIVIESWLNTAAPSRSRGRVLGLYTLLNLTIIMVGQQLVNLAAPTGFQVFSVVAILISLAAVPLVLTRSLEPRPPRTAKLRLGWVLAISPASVVTCLAAGLVSGAFWSLGPVFGLGADGTVAGSAIFMSAAVLGGASSQWPLGRWSDHTDRRLVLVFSATIGLAAALALAMSNFAGGTNDLLLAFVFGAGALSLYSVAVAHANDRITTESAVDVSSNLLLVYAVGAVAGPLMASWAMAALGIPGLFLYVAVVLAPLTIALALLILAKPAVPLDRHKEFVAVPRTSPSVFELDVRKRNPRRARSSAPTLKVPRSTVG